MNPFRRFFEIVANPSNSRTVGVLVILIIALAIPLTVNIAQKQQELRQHAAPVCQTVSLGVYCSDISTSISGVTCTPGGVGNCPGGQTFTCSQLVCNEQPATPPSTVPAPACTPTVATTCDIDCTIPSNCGKTTTCNNDCTPINGSRTPGVCKACPAQIAPATSCPGSGIPSSVFNDGHEEWGGACVNGVDTGRAVAIPGTCSCIVSQCLQYSSGPYCWVNNGQKYDDAKGCAAKGAAMPASCLGVAATCPGTGDAITPTQAGGTFGFGGECGSISEKKYFSAGNNKYYYEECEQHSNGKLCWFNSGIGSPLACPATNPPVDSGCTAPAAPAAPSAATCKTDSASASTCAFACQTVNGVNMKCNIQNQNTSGVCSGACTGQWNCAVDSACQNPNGAILSFSLGLDGIGTTGDVKNPTLSNAKSPIHSIRNLTLKLINSSGVEVSTFNGNISYSSGRFTASVNLGSVALGTYTIKIKSDGYLWRLINTPLTITTGTVTYTLTGSSVSLITGDIIVNNAVDIQDYNQLLSCIFKTVSSTPGCQTSDLDDSGTVDLADFNLLLREFGSAGN